MGRSITENNNFIYKYAFATQPSEQSRIFTEFKIGFLLYEITDICNYSNNCDNCYNTHKCDDLIEYKILNKNQLKKSKDNITGDILYLNISDNNKLKKILDNNMDKYTKAIKIKKEYDKYLIDGNLNINLYDEMNEKIFKICNDFYFYQLLDTFIKYMEHQYKYKHRKDFIFRGNY